MFGQAKGAAGALLVATGRAPRLRVTPENRPTGRIAVKARWKQDAAAAS